MFQCFWVIKIPWSNQFFLKDATEYIVFFKDISSCVYTRKVYWSDCTLWRTNIAIEQPSSSIGNTFSNWYSFNCHVGLPECVAECYILVPISQMFKQNNAWNYHLGVYWGLNDPIVLTHWKPVKAMLRFLLLQHWVALETSVASLRSGPWTRNRPTRISGGFLVESLPFFLLP